MILVGGRGAPSLHMMLRTCREFGIFALCGDNGLEVEAEVHALNQTTGDMANEMSDDARARGEELRIELNRAAAGRDIESRTPIGSSS